MEADPEARQVIDPAAALYNRLLLAGFVLRITAAGRLSVSPADELDDETRRLIGLHARQMAKLVREDEQLLNCVLDIDWSYHP